MLIRSFRVIFRPVVMKEKLEAEKKREKELLAGKPPLVRSFHLADRQHHLSDSQKPHLKLPTEVRCCTGLSAFIAGLTFP